MKRDRFSGEIREPIGLGFRPGDIRQSQAGLERAVDRKAHQIGYLQEVGNHWAHEKICG